jgi:hypothetical protein
MRRGSHATEGGMLRSLLIVALLVSACHGKTAERVAETTTPSVPPPPIGFVGEWVQVAPVAYSGNTLTLRADSSASGRLPHYRADTAGVASATRWRVMFMSHEPVASRTDWWGGHTDGGEADCTLTGGPDSPPGCRSGPLLCFGDADRWYGCLGFRFNQDSLALSTGDRYVRAGRATARGAA